MVDVDPFQRCQRGHDLALHAHPVSNQITGQHPLQQSRQHPAVGVVWDGGKGWSGRTGDTCHRTNPAPQAAHSTAAKLCSTSTAH
jgi:hypothetical protein